MPLWLTWHEIALRLALSAMAGGLIGLDRGEHGRPAGLRNNSISVFGGGRRHDSNEFIAGHSWKSSRFVRDP